MEVNNLIFVCLISACVIFSSVQSASFHNRNEREIETPIANEINREEIVSELRKEPEVTAIETEPIAAIIREEVVVPVDQLRVVAPVIEIQEPVALVSEKEESNAVVDDAVALRSANAESIVPVVIEEKIVSVPIVEEPVAVAAIEEIIPKTRNEPLVGIDEKEVVPVADVKTEDKKAPIEVAAVFVRSNPDEPLVAENENVVNADSTIVENDEAIRQNEAAPVAPAAPAAPPRPSVIQTIQTNIQNFQHQIQSVFNPAAANSDPTVPTTPRPGFIAQFQQAVGSVFNRPTGSAPGPIQGFVSAVQNNLQQAQTNLQGIFRPGGASAAAAPAAETVPVVVAPVDPVAEKTMLDEVPVVNEKIKITIQKGPEKVDEVKSD